MDPEPGIHTVAVIDYEMLFGSIGIIVLLFCCAMVAAAEVAFFSLTHNDLKLLAEKHPSKFLSISELLSKPKKLLASILIANNFLHIAIVILFSVSLDRLFATITIPLVKFMIDYMF